MSSSRTRARSGPRFCYWTVADREYADLAAGMIASARRCGVTEDFHVWTDRPEIPGAITHVAGDFDAWGWLFKLVFLQEEVRQLEYDYFIYLDADNRFVRHPGDILGLVQTAPLHLSLEADLTDPRRRESWWEYPAATFVALARQNGVTHSSIFTANAGMFIVQREAIPLVYQLANAFWLRCRQESVWYVDEPLLAYAMQRLCPDPGPHTLERTHRFWATDWDGAYRDRLPTDAPFRFHGQRRSHDLLVNPAIVHALRSKSALLRDAVAAKG